MLPLLSPRILYHHILPLLRLRKNSASALLTQWNPGYDEKHFIFGTLLTWTAQVSNIFGVGSGPQIYTNGNSNGGEKQGRCYKNWQEHSFVSDDVCEAITENWSAQLDESDSITKRKRLETTYEKCAQLLGNEFNDIRRLFTTGGHTNIDLLGVCSSWPHCATAQRTVWMIWTAHFAVGILLLHHYRSDLAHLSYLYNLVIGMYKS